MKIVSFEHVDKAIRKKSGIPLFVLSLVTLLSSSDGLAPLLVVWDLFTGESLDEDLILQLYILLHVMTAFVFGLLTCLLPYRIISICLHAFCPFVLLFTWYPTLDRWPGGDDAGGLRWGFIVGGATIIVCIWLWVGCLTIIYKIDAHVKSICPQRNSITYCKFRSL